MIVHLSQKKKNVMKNTKAYLKSNIIRLFVIFLHLFTSSTPFAYVFCLHLSTRRGDK
jgi:hypothetical protein